VKHRAALQTSLLKETAPAEGDLAGALFPEVHAGGGPRACKLDTLTAAMFLIAYITIRYFFRILQ
jgi:hypothetical protein